MLSSVPQRVVRSCRIWIEGEEVLHVPEPIDKLGDRAFRVASPAALLDGIRHEASRHPNFTYDPATRFTGVVRDGAGRVAGARAVRDGQHRELPTDLLVGCDGRGSSVRTDGYIAFRSQPATA